MDWEKNQKEKEKEKKIDGLEIELIDYVPIEEEEELDNGLDFGM